MKKIILFALVFCFIGLSDSQKHNFTFTVKVNGITLDEAGRLEDEIIELIEDYKSKSVKVVIDKHSSNIYNLWQRYDVKPTQLRYLHSDTYQLFYPNDVNINAELNRAELHTDSKLGIGIYLNKMDKLMELAK